MIKIPENSRRLLTILSEFRNNNDLCKLFSSYTARLKIKYLPVLLLEILICPVNSWKHL